MTNDTTTVINGHETSMLRWQLELAASIEGCSMDALTVLAAQNDPYRIDTPARHRDGQWLAMTADRLGLGQRVIHLRGLHYMLIGQPKPDGKPYTNTEADWTWLSEKAAKAARWLGHIPFAQIVDQRNAAPVIRRWTPPEPVGYLNAGIEVDIPDPEDLHPQVNVDDFRGTQPYKLVLIGEKSSLDPILTPVADRFQCDLYLPTGEPSDTQLYQMAWTAEQDGRPMVVLYFSDCDPAGWQMPISVARKLQAFKTLEFEDIEFQVRRVALTPEQVHEHGLPSTPLKATELRGDRWQAAMGVEQTEIDALAALQPQLLTDIAINAVRPFFDSTLARRVREAREAWTVEAQAVLDANLDPDQMERLHAAAAEQLGTMRAQIDNLNDAARIDSEVELPEIVIPQAELNGGPDGLPLIDSSWDFADQCLRLKAAKAYEGES